MRPTRTVSVVGWKMMMRRGSAEEHAGEGRGIHHKTLVAAAVEVRHRKPGAAAATALPVECDWPSLLVTAAAIPCVTLSRAPSCQAR